MLHLLHTRKEGRKGGKGERKGKERKERPHFVNWALPVEKQTGFLKTGREMMIVGEHTGKP